MISRRQAQRSFRNSRRHLSDPKLTPLETVFIQEASQGLAAPLKAVRHPWRTVYKCSGAVAMICLIAVIIDASIYASKQPSERAKISRDNLLELISFQVTDELLGLKNGAVNTLNDWTKREPNGAPPPATK